MKKRIIMLIFLAIMLTGCSVNYKLEINDDQVVETMILTQRENSTYTRENINSSYKEEYPVFKDEEFLYYAPTEKIDGNTYYTKDLSSNNGVYTAKYVANYSFNDYSRSRILDTAYKHYSSGYNRSSNTYYITANDLKIFSSNKNIDEIVVSVNLDGYEVVKSNQHNKNGNNYIWTFNRGDEGTINIEFKKEGNNTTSTSSNKNNGSSTKEKKDYSTYILSGILLILFFIGYLIYKTITKDNESIE